MSERIGEVYFRGKALEILKETYYSNERPAIILHEKGDPAPYATLTTNMIHESLEDGEFFVKDWTENEEIAAHILEFAGLFEDTGKTVPSGHVEVPIWRFKDG